MRAAFRNSIFGALVAGLGALAGGETAEAFDNAVLRGPAVAIAKAKEAAAKAEHRAQTSDQQSATALGAAGSEAKATEKAEASPSEKAEEAPPAVSGDGAAGTEGEEAEGESDVEISYDPTAHRDPFVPMLLKGVAAARTPLENYQLGQLKLVGIVTQPPEGFRAMVEDSSGLGYIIITGTPIGSSGGVVRSIEPRRVVIEESIRDFYGDMKPKEVVMELPQEDRSP